MAFIKSSSINSRNNQSLKCEVVDETNLTSEIPCPTHTCLAQTVERQSGDQEVLGSIPIRGRNRRIMEKLDYDEVCYTDRMSLVVYPMY